MVILAGLLQHPACLQAAGKVAVLADPCMTWAPQHLLHTVKLGVLLCVHVS
jgi:hypothetical protein